MTTLSPKALPGSQQKWNVKTALSTKGALGAQESKHFAHTRAHAREVELDL